jgi:DNA polymerase (family X)
MATTPQFTNADIAGLLTDVAAVYTLNGENIFRIKAFQTAANSIEQYPVQIQDIWQEEKALDNIPGVGKAIAGDIQELFEKGHVRHFDEVKSLVPAGVFALMSVQGIGPKTAFKLAKHFELNDQKTAVATLLQKAKAGEVAKVESFSEVKQTRIISAIENQREKPQARLLLPIAEQIAADVMAYLRTSSDVLDIEALGSLRRHSPTVGDVDMAVKTKNSDAVMAHIRAFPHINRLIGSGEKTTTFIHSSGWQVDIKTSEPERWGSMLQHYTGSKLHNIHLRTIAQKKGLSLSEAGIKTDGTQKTYDTEEKFYAALGLQWVPPELREDSGEIQAAAKKALPKLIEREDIKGDVHMHTNLKFPTSHDMGTSTIDDLLTRARELEYKYIGFSDHNPKRSGLSAAERYTAVQDRNAQIDEVVERFFKGKSHPMKVYKGLEIDILPDGNLALEDDAIDLLDYAIVSLHSQFTQESKTVTARIIKGLSHPKVKIMGHPTGRLLQSRDGADANWKEVFAYCAEHDKIMEINSAPDRTDLPSTLITLAIQMGVKLIIDTDSHSADGLDLMKYGVYNARRGWATKEHIVNTQKSLPF